MYKIKITSKRKSFNINTIIDDDDEEDDDDDDYSY